ncbi:hypothetical protein Tco_0739529 [Tanacetum coccineum]
MTSSKRCAYTISEEFDDLLGTTFDFSNFVKNRLKKDKLAKEDIEGPVFELLKGTCGSDRISQDLSTPLPLLGAPGRLYILVDYFFNKDLEYLRSKNLEERKYTALFTKAKVTRYELYRIEEMIPKQWSPSKLAYGKDAAYEISQMRIIANFAALRCPTSSFWHSYTVTIENEFGARY